MRCWTPSASDVLSTQNRPSCPNKINALTADIYPRSSMIAVSPPDSLQPFIFAQISPPEASAASTRNASCILGQYPRPARRPARTAPREPCHWLPLPRRGWAKSSGTPPATRDRASAGHPFSFVRQSDGRGLPAAKPPKPKPFQIPNVRKQVSGIIASSAFVHRGHYPRLPAKNPFNSASASAAAIPS